MDGQQQPDSSRGHCEAWELQLVRMTAARFRTTEREELEAELALHLLRVKRFHRARAEHWKAYLAAALRNKASNWIRDRQRRERDRAHLDVPVSDEESPTRADVVAGPEANEDLRAAFAALWEELEPRLRDVWEILLQEGGNQVQTAKRLNIHRNTLRSWVGRIQEVAARHGFRDRR
jgi:RNA polymerase sigma factor (sigma-70 family)